MYKSKLSEIFSWNDFFFYANTLTEKGKGDIFETLTKLILITRPEYSSIVKNVWIQREGVPKDIRERINLPLTDEGIDLIAETFHGEFWAIQCKFKGQNQIPTYKELSTFGNLANNYCKNIAFALLVHTGEKGVRKRILLGENYTEIGLDFWLGLTKEDWLRIHKYLKGQSIRPKPKEPRPHQQSAIRNATKHFIKNKAKRGRLIMPCGTGKSLTAFWIANALGVKSVIVVVPSLALIKQSLEDWTREFIAHKEDPRPEWLVICSDESTAKIDKDEFVSDAHSMGIPTTTNVNDISAFLTNNNVGRKIIFTTYQSSDKLAEASRKCKFSFDFAILDEAHKTVGIKSKTFATLLSERNISISKRMFMTATERLIKGSNEDVYSMDDEAIYGKVFHQLTFKDAIQSTPPIICDYKVLTITVTNDEIKHLIDKNKLLTDKEKKLEEQEAQSLASALALRKATRKYGIKHAISFHRSIRSAYDFADLHNTLNFGNIDDINLATSHISSKKSAGERARLLNDFANEQLALMTNARCLSEGVDVPAIDCVLFADPKQSIVDIAQASGRALRPFEGKDYGYIMLPIIVPDGVDFDEFTDTTSFKAVARIISALSTQDESIAEEFRLINSGKQKTGEQKIIFEGNIPVGMELDLSSFASKINAKIWEKVSRVNYRPFFEARAYAHTLKLRNIDEWYEYTKSGKTPPDIPAAANKAYFDKGWKGWSDWLGNNRSSPKENYLPFIEARNFVHKLKLNSKLGWREYCLSGQKPTFIPSHPWDTYKGKGWTDIGDWTGMGPRRIHRSFEEARAFVHKLKLKNHHEWRSYCGSGNKPKDIPTTAEKTYKNKGWSGFGDWLGNGNIWTASMKFRSFEEAREFVHELKLKNSGEWKIYSNSGNKPKDIPKSPDIAYKNNGWSGMKDFLGTQIFEPHLIEYRSFNEAREFIHKLNLKNVKEWKEYCNSGQKPADIPESPFNIYRNKGWKNIGDWLGIYPIHIKNRTYLPFNHAREFVQKLNIQNRRSWREYCKSGQKPKNIPAHPNNIYKNKGWLGMGDFLGTYNKTHAERTYRSFEEARAFVHTLKLKTYPEWRKFTKTKEMPKDIPNSPIYYYKGKGWKDCGDWLGTNSVNIGKKGNRKYLPFEEARAYILTMNLQNKEDWWNYCQLGKKPKNIPENPQTYYRGRGWIGYDYWLGIDNKFSTKKSRLRDYRQFEEARAFVQSLNLKGVKGWREYCKSNERPPDIPSNPNVIYLDNGWIGYGDWLGT